MFIKNKISFNILSKLKNRIELSESDDSLPLISRSPSRSPVISHQSLIATHSTKIGNKFPRYDRTKKSVRPIVRLSEYGSNSMRRQMSLQHSPRTNLKKVNAMSTQSLSDNLICESSLKAMLALEDMRGERTSAFSRGLKNLKYLPKRMIQMKTKISDSFDDESDQDSIYSSTWSIGGSDSTRSSINDPIQSLRKKKFTHKKNEGGIAALLIRSVHANFPLDSVLEDRETPTPSPVNFIHDFEDINDPPLRKITDNEKDLSMKKNLNNDLTIKNIKFDFPNKRIPMISSSESDTSTSDDDEPSESSTNYNILDDSLSGIDLSSLSSDKSFIKPQKNDEVIKKNTSSDHENNSYSTMLVDKLQGTSSETDDLNLLKNIPVCRDDSIPEGIILDYDSATDESFVPLVSSLSSTSDNILNQSSSLKLKYLIKQKSFDASDDAGFLITSTPTETTEEPKFPSTQTTNLIDNNDHVKLNIVSLIELDPEIPHPSSSKLSIEENKSEIISVLHQTILPLKIEIPSSVNSTEPAIKNNNLENLKDTNNLSLSAPSSVLCNKKIKKIFHSDSFDDKNLSVKKGKISKKVTRTETVIYKGPIKENNDKLKKIKSSTPLSPTIVVASPSEKESQLSSIKSDCHLRVPIGESKEVNIHSPCTFEDKETPEFSLPNKYSMEAQIMSERFKRKYRQHCMLDLIRTIDAKMMVHHMHNNRKDSKKKRHDKNHVNLTPSPESINRIRHRRNSRSKSPEKQHHHGHHNHSHHNHQLPLSSPSSSSSPHTLTAKKEPPTNLSSTENLSLNNSNNNNYSKTICIDENKKSLNDKLIIKNVENIDEKNNHNFIIINNNNNYNHIDNFNREDNNFKENLNIDLAVYKSHSDSNLDDLRDKLSTNITNNANNTDDMCVPCPLIIPRQQEEISATPPTQVLPGSVGTKLPNSPAIKHPGIPLHRRSSDSDLSITPKGEFYILFIYL